MSRKVDIDNVDIVIKHYKDEIYKLRSRGMTHIVALQMLDSIRQFLKDQSKED